MEKLLNFNEPVDVRLLDMVVNAVFFGSPQEVCLFLASQCVTDTLWSETTANNFASDGCGTEGFDAISRAPGRLDAS